MKFLKYLLFFLLALVLFFLGSGLLNPSVSYESEIVVNKSAQESWAVMSDESTLAEWIEGYKRSESISGTPNTVGAVTKIYVEENGEEMSMDETITDIRNNELMAMKFTMDFMDMDYKMTLKEKDGKTHIKTFSKTVGNGLIAKSIISFMPSSMKAQEDKNLNNLKKLIESNTKKFMILPYSNPSM